MKGSSSENIKKSKSSLLLHAATDLKGFHAKTGSPASLSELESSQLNSFGTGAGMQNDDCCWPPSKWKKCIS